jgi:hypothetical protein
VIFINVRRKCFAVANQTENYYALSYICGQCSTLRTLRSNLGEFQREYAISIDIMAIPTTIRDVTRLVVLLGESYLWVDIMRIYLINGTWILREVDYISFR